MENQFKEEILSKLGSIGLWDISGKRAERISMFIEDVRVWSGRIHLLGRKDIYQNIERQIIDSAYMLKFLEVYLPAADSGNRDEGDADKGESPDKSGKILERHGGDTLRGKRLEGRGENIFRGKRLADIGSGAGFPGLVWKILRPELEINLFERKEKTAVFLSREAGVLGLKRVTVSGIDVEKYTGDDFDIVTSKAAGRLPEMLPLAAGLLSNGGLYTTVKGDGWRKEEGTGPFSGMVFEREDAMPEKRGRVVIFGKTAGM